MLASINEKKSAIAMREMIKDLPGFLTDQQVARGRRTRACCSRRFCLSWCAFSWASSRTNSVLMNSSRFSTLLLASIGSCAHPVLPITPMHADSVEASDMGDFREVRVSQFVRFRGALPCQCRIRMCSLFRCKAPTIAIRSFQCTRYLCILVLMI